MTNPGRSLVARMCLALLLAVGAGVAWGIAAAYINEWRKDLVGIGVPLGEQKKLFVGVDGTVLVRVYRNVTSEFLTLDSRPAASVPTELEMFSFGVPAKRDPALAPLERYGWAGRVIPFADNTDPPTFWYLVVSDVRAGLGYFVGYDSLTYERVGYLGRDGLSQSMPGPENQFLIDAADFASLYPVHRGYALTPLPGARPAVVYLLSADRFWTIDLQRRSVTDATGLGDIIAVGRASWRAATQRGTMTDIVKFFLRRPGRIAVYDPAADSVTEFVLPEELHDKDLTFYPLEKGTALAVVRHGDARYIESSYNLFRINTVGEVLDRQSVAFGVPEGWTQSLRDEYAVAALAAPSPAVQVAVLSIPLPGTEKMSLGEKLAHAWPGLAFVLVVTIAGAVVTERMCRRFGEPQRLAWIAFVLLTGLPGLFGFLLYRRWPARVPPPPPQRTGAEVFA